MSQSGGPARPQHTFAEARARELAEREAQRRGAVRAVARRSRGHGDQVMLMSMLGLETTAEPPGPTAGTLALTAEPPGLGKALAGYAALVAEQVGVPAEAVTTEVTDTATAYLGLAGDTPTHPGRDLMLVWDERLGWRVAVEPGGAQREPVLRYLGGDTVPAPATVAGFARDVLAGRSREQFRPVPPPLDRAELAARMAAFVA
jgi:hypothetical protein